MTTLKGKKTGRARRSVQWQPPPTDTGGVRRWGTDLEQLRCDVLSRHIARVASEDKQVRELRELLLGGPIRTVSIERALDLLGSPATKYLGPEWFQTNGIPFALHEAVEGGHENILGPDFLDRRVCLTVSWPGGTRKAEPEVRISHEKRGVSTQQLDAPGRHGSRTLLVFHGTYLERLKKSCTRLCDDYLWTEVDAILFLMCGIAPTVKPVHAAWEVVRDTAGQPLRTEVMLNIQPFVSIDSVDRLLTTVRVMLGRRRRPGPAMAHRTLALFEFVEETRAREDWATPPWSELVGVWDVAHEQDGWGYGGDRRNFRRDYERANHLLLRDYLPARERRDAAQDQPAAQRGSARRKS